MPGWSGGLWLDDATATAWWPVHPITDQIFREIFRLQVTAPLGRLVV